MESTLQHFLHFQHFQKFHRLQRFQWQVDGNVNPVLTSAVAAVVVCVGVWLWWQLHWWQRNPLAPRNWPVLGALVELTANWSSLHDLITRYLKSAHTVKIGLGFGTEMVVTAHPGNIEHVMKTNFANYPKGPMLRSINHDFFGEGIFNADGELWRHQRKVAAVEFASSRLRDFSTQVFREYALRLAVMVSDRSRTKSHFDLQDLTSRMTLDTTVRIAFGVDLGSLAPALPLLPVADSYETASRMSFLRFVRPLWPLERWLQLSSHERRLKHAVQTLDQFAFDLILKKKGELPRGRLLDTVNEEKDDLLSRFVKMSQQGDSRFGDRALRDIMVNYILAGRDSTSAVLCWTLYMLILHPEAMAKIRAELATLQPGIDPDQKQHPTEVKALQAFAELLTFENVGNLTYLHAVLTETMRIYPPVPFNAKQAVDADTLPDGTVVKKGSMVAFHPYGMGRMPYVWGPDAEEFKPERWIKDGIFQPESPFKYIAFQGGPRLCLGKDSAYLQMKIAMALLVQFFDFELVPGHRVHYKTMISLVLADGLEITARKRCLTQDMMRGATVGRSHLQDGSLT